MTILRHNVVLPPAEGPTISISSSELSPPCSPHLNAESIYSIPVLYFRVFSTTFKTCLKDVSSLKPFDSAN